MATAEAITQLQSVPLFSGLDDRELKLLATLVKERSYAAGSTIVADGATGYGLYIIKEGAASVRKEGRVVARMGPGEFFGEIAMLDNGPRTASVVAETDTVCLTLVSWEIKPLLTENAGLTYKMLQEVVRRLRQARAAD